MKARNYVLIRVACCIMPMAMFPAATEAVSYVPHNVVDQVTADTNAHKRQGTMVFIFHGATPEALHLLVGQEISVFRESGAGCPAEKHQVGKIRILKLSGNHHLEAVVLEGDLRDGDIAHLGGSYGLVVPVKEHCETPPRSPESGH